MSAFSAIDLSKLPAPAVVEELDYETILEDLKVDFVERYPDYEADLESDPVAKLLEVSAYRELLVRQRVNEAAQAVMLAYATSNDLDNLGALVPVERGDDEEDDDFRKRVQLAPEAFSTAGPTGAYEYWAISVAGVKEAAASTPAPGDVLVVVLAQAEPGEADEELLAAVNDVVNDTDVRPLTDHVTVQSVEIVSFEIDATLHVSAGPSASVVQASAEEALAEMLEDRRAIGQRVPLSAIYAALHVEGVVEVELAAPTADVVCTFEQAPYCSSVSLSVVEED